MSFTNPDNLKNPEVLGDYINAKWAESNAFIQSGVLGTPNVPQISTMGSKIEIPTWKALGDMEVLEPGADVSYEGMDDFTQIHPMVRLTKGIRNLDLAETISSGSPIEATGNQLANIVNRSVNKNAIATLQGCTAANTANSLADTGADPSATDLTLLDNVFGDIIQTYLGQGFWFMRSEVFHQYRDLGLVADPIVGDELQDSIVAGRNFYNIRGSIFGRNIIVDDEIYRAGLTSKTSGDSLVYLIGENSLLSAQQTPVTVEQGRDISKQADVTVMKFARTMGMDGMSFTANVPNKGISDTALRNSSNWELVAEDNRFIGSASIQVNPPA